MSVLCQFQQFSDSPAVLLQADLHPYFPYLHVTATADVVVFQPVVGMYLGKELADQHPGCAALQCLLMLCASWPGDWQVKNNSFCEGSFQQLATAMAWSTRADKRCLHAEGRKGSSSSAKQLAIVTPFISSGL